ncbi:MAG: hypothetical protein GY856_44575 [bacterium]|nr:hypothetical protein [bacterium]
MLYPEQPEDILRHPRYWTVTFCRAFLDSYGEEAFGQPRTGQRLAVIGIDLVSRVEERTGEELPALRARALAIRGSSCRAAGNLEGAREYYGQARQLYDQLEEPLDEADLLRRCVFLHRDLEQWQEAIDCAKMAAKIFLAAGDKQRYGLVLVVKATVLTRMRQPEPAIPILSKALAYLDYDRSPQAFYSGVHNLTVALAQAPDPSPELVATALRWLREARRAGPPRGIGAREYGYRKRTVPDAKLRHVLALLLRRSGKPRTATRFLEEARQDLAALELPLDVVGVALDLGELYAEEGRWAELEQVSSETVQLLAPLPEVSQLRKAVRQWQLAIFAREQPAETTTKCRELLPYFPTGEAFEAGDNEGTLRRRLSRAVDAAVRGCHSLEELSRRLTAQNITIHLRPPRGARPAGIAFEFQGHRFTGHQLGRPFRLSGITARLKNAGGKERTA